MLLCHLQQNVIYRGVFVDIQLHGRILHLHIDDMRSNTNCIRGLRNEPYCHIHRRQQMHQADRCSSPTTALTDRLDGLVTVTGSLKGRGGTGTPILTHRQYSDTLPNCFSMRPLSSGGKSSSGSPSPTSSNTNHIHMKQFSSSA